MPCSCACKKHQEFSGGEDSFIHKVSNRKIKADVLNHMKSNDLLPKSFTGICQKCIDHVNDYLLPQSRRKRKNSILNDLLNEINTESVDEEGLILIAEALGKRISAHIDHDKLHPMVHNIKTPTNYPNFL